LLRQRIERVLHLLHHVLEHGIGHIADEQVMLRVPIGNEVRALIRGFCFHPTIFVVSVTRSQGSWYQLPPEGIRGISYPDSWFYLPRFVVSVTFFGKGG